MKLSARNMIKGKVVNISTGQVMATVKLDIGGGNTITSVLTKDSASDMDIKVGDEIYAVVKSTEVLLAKE